MSRITPAHRSNTLNVTDVAAFHAQRRFPPPWSIEELDACFVVRDHNGQALAYVYFEDEPGRRFGIMKFVPATARSKWRHGARKRHLGIERRHKASQ